MDLANVLWETSIITNSRDISLTNVNVCKSWRCCLASSSDSTILELHLFYFIWNINVILLIFLNYIILSFTKRLSQPIYLIHLKKLNKLLNHHLDRPFQQFVIHYVSLLQFNVWQNAQMLFRLWNVQIVGYIFLTLSRCWYCLLSHELINGNLFVKSYLFDIV